MNNSQFTKSVIITGAANGIGRTLARRYAESGAKVILADTDEPRGEDNVRTIREAGGEALFVRTDMSRPEEIVRLIAQAVKAYGPIGSLINNAGVSVWKTPYELSVEEWDHVLHTNLRGTFLCAREAAKRMRVSGGGSIVNIASTRSMMSEPSSEAYAASKGGIAALTHALAVSFGRDRIRVNCISPGWIETGEYEALRQADHDQHPAGRVGTPDDIVRACFYLTDPANDFVTGTDLVIDGGMTRKMIYEE
ncbi:SDR family NAD(P)-dependent oxidoreductase [Paenibacillus sp. FJAT-26967]|uniref:SDR family NAD(P)-dependent oxidoreductase n=1 Tax=Paenibacillus sp. FJAT-26967 TaxID=1729690 RepID=UPI0008395C17|nr:glucose 1-dehydrogenase [Paenibacillus sp. FJAT-26967]